MAHLRNSQIKQLIEIDEAGSGIRAELQELITRLTSGGIGCKTDDPRKVQAKVLWDKGFGRRSGFDSFDAYLASIPEIPEFPESYAERFPLLVLVDARLTLTQACALAGLRYKGDDETFVDFDAKQARKERVYWMRVQDGHKNRNVSVTTCRRQFAKDELGLVAMEGVALYGQHPAVILSHYLDLPGSVHRGNRGRFACLGLIDGEPGLSWYWHDDANPLFGSASRGE